MTTIPAAPSIGKIFNPEGFGILRRCFRYLRPYRNDVIIAYITLAIMDVASVIVPIFIQRGIDLGIRQGNTAVLGRACLILLGLGLVRAIATYGMGFFTERSSQGVAHDLRRDLFDRLLALSFSFHDQAQSGQLLARAIGDVERIRFLTGRAVLRIVESISLIVITAAVLFTLNLPLGLLAISTMPFVAYFGLRYGLKARPLTQAVQQQNGEIASLAEQNLRGARVVKAFRQEASQVHEFEQRNLVTLNLNTQLGRVTATFTPLMDFFTNLSTVIVLIYGGLLVVNGRLTIGQFVGFTTYLAQLSQPVQRLGDFIVAVANAISCGERIFGVIDAPSEVNNAPDAVDLSDVHGRVTFENVHFSYQSPGSKPAPALRGVSFEAEPGQVVALVGPTGSGKTSVINLIPRFYDVTSGAVCIDGQDVRHLTLTSLRAPIGIVLQESTLFATTIRENIRFGRPAAGEEEVIAAAKAAAAHDFISAMPDGYDTEVGERGVTLSGGQKQRIAIARALLVNPRILILDDSTSSVDATTEKLIQDALDRLMAGRTTFIIAQRLSTVQRADVILVMEQGQIVASGRHDELCETSPLYADICRHQLRRLPSPPAPHSEGEGDWPSPPALVPEGKGGAVGMRLPQSVVARGRGAN